MPKRLEQKKRFIELLAHFLVDDQAAKSITLQMDASRPNGKFRPSLAREWAALRSASTVIGYAEYKEAVETLNELLS